MSNNRPESPLMKLVRVLGGVALTHGPFGHQVLGQLLITNLTQAEFAGAALASAIGSRRRNVFAQAAINTAAPAVALQALIDKAERRLTRREQNVAKREEQMAQHSTALEAQIAALKIEKRQLTALLEATRSSSKKDEEP